ncbi:death domain-containing protein 1 [Pempheris klunzingeri]|uniref:death domain-containing protein 1 n=1 Tax=Pempheris klunzingeri TaxID=3127111 RepID=UPI003980EBD0
MLTEAIRGLEAVRRSRDHHNGTAGGRRCTGGDAGRGGREEIQGGRGAGGMLSAAEDEKGDEERGGNNDDEERGREQRVLGVLRELSVSHAGGLTAWREALRRGARMLAKSPPGGSDQLQSSTADGKVTPCSDSFAITFLSVGEDIESITDKMNAIITKLDTEIQRGRSEEASASDAAPQETRDPKEQPENDNNHLNSHDPLVCDCGYKQDDEGGDDHSRAMPSPDAEQTSDSGSSSCDCSDVGETGRESVVKGQGDDEEGQTGKDTNVLHDKGREETNNEWITVGLAGQRESRPDVPDACFITAPTGVADALRCEVADTLSCLMVAASEELVSRVIRVKVQDGANVRFPVIVVVPFSARYRGNYRDVAMKIVDGERRGSYITPVTTEGTYGGQRGSFAEVRVYSLGLFAVVSCLKRENYTVPTKGLSLKLPMDPRICLNYLPGSFTAPVMAQTRIQPIDAVLLGAVKSRSDAYHSVVSTSPLLYLTHPSSQPLRRLLTLILPCPPNPDKKRHARGPGEERGHQTRPVSASPSWDGPAASHRRMILVASVKSKEMSNELLIVLGSRDKQWSVLDKVTVRNQQNGLVSFELTENFDRLLVVRLLSALQPCHLTSLAEELEESVCCQAVTVVFQRRPDEPHAVLVAAVPSRDLSWELSRLHAQGYSGLPEASSEISMCEGDQLLLQFSGNITSTGSQNGQLNAPHERITFHSQQKNHLVVRLIEVDPFGNYSSPHYKGTAVFYKVTRGQLEWRGDRPAPMDPKLLGEPVCKLPLTLPKKVRAINRPIIARVKLCEETDSLSDSLLLWLSGELSKEEVALLTLSLRLRRSAAQLVKLRAGESQSTQAFHVLAMWRRGLPVATHQPKASQLAHCLAKSGRPDLARELLLRHAAATRQGSLKQRHLKSRNHTAF